MEPRHYYSTKYARTAARLEEAEKTIEELLIALNNMLRLCGDPEILIVAEAIAVLKKHGKV